MLINIEMQIEDSSVALWEDQIKETLSTLLASKQMQTEREPASPCFRLLLSRVNNISKEIYEMQHQFSEGFKVQ